MRWFLPKKVDFLDLFDRGSANIVRGVTSFVAAITEANPTGPSNTLLNQPRPRFSLSLDDPFDGTFESLLCGKPPPAESVLRFRSGTIVP